MNTVTHFPEKISPFLQSKLHFLQSKFGTNSPEYHGLAIQYSRDMREDQDTDEHNLKHYEAQIHGQQGESHLPGLERLYKRTLVIEPSLVCLAHCRYCLRSNYSQHTLSEKQLIDVAKYCGSPQNSDTINEVLISGGDPLLIPQRLEILLNALQEYAPNIQIIRIGSRLFTQDPKRIDENVTRLFASKPGLRFEVATQINHPSEFFPEVIDAFNRIIDHGVKIYSQNVLLKGVNDDLSILVALYNLMRLHNIESHYLFHCVPMKGIHHFRTTISRGLSLAKDLVCSGNISGRAKPMYAAMTDIGKITFYDGVILDRKDRRVLLQSNYRIDDRLSWNPTWKIPSTAEIDEHGLLRVWYLDGED